MNLETSGGTVQVERVKELFRVGYTRDEDGCTACIFECRSWLGKLLGATFIEGDTYRGFHTLARMCERGMLNTHDVFKFPVIVAEGIAAERRTMFIFARTWESRLLEEGFVGEKKMWLCFRNADHHSMAEYRIADARAVRNYPLYFVMQAFRFLSWATVPLLRRILSWYHHGWLGKNDMLAIVGKPT